MVPVSFDNCFGWLHPGHSARGVVLMNSFGFEELCSRKTFVLLAQALAERGIPVLRFDWSGTGDSLGGPLDPGQYETWRSNAQAAIATFQAQTGVKEIVLAGLRLGAFLAAEAACTQNAVTRVILLAPPASGKSWLREAATFARIMAAPGTSSPGFDGLEVAGFRLSSQTTEAIKSQQWTAMARRPAARADIFTERPGSADPLVQCLELLGAQVHCQEFAGYDAMMCDPTASQTPMALIETLAADIAAHAPAASVRPPKPAFTPLSGHGFAETPARIPLDTHDITQDIPQTLMTGILSYPLAKSQRSEAIILLNAGAVHHGGWARMYVDLSRRLARHGIASLRLDLPGIGDSATLRDPPVASLYARKMSAEISNAIAWLKARGYRRITLAGACSGAYQAFHAASADERVDALVLLNQLCFQWSKSYALQFNAWQATKSRAMQVQVAQAGESEMLQATRAFAQLLPVAKKFAKGSLSAMMSLQTFAANALSREKPVEAAFMKLSARGAQVLLAYSSGDAGLAELERHCGPGGVNAIALPGVEKFIIENADHMLTPMRAREVFADRLVAFLDAAHASANPEAAPETGDHAAAIAS